jgi:hypothetical protein
MRIKTTQINRKIIIWLLEQNLDVKITELHHHLDISRMLVNDILEDEVNSCADSRYNTINRMTVVTVAGELIRAA